MAQAVILLGGNQGDRFMYLSKSKEFISKQIGSLRKISSIYETEAWGFKAEQDFLNQVLVVETLLKPMDLLHKTQRIEKILGRVRPAHSHGYVSRSIDIDILFYDNEIIETPDLQIPHIYLHHRKFTLEPLAEIIPFWLHPIFNKSVEELVMNCKDTSKVRKLVKRYA